MGFSSAQLTPLRLPGFRNLFFATLCSSAGTLLAAVALAIDIQARTNSGPWVAAVFIVEFLPTVVVGLLFGPLLDRFERRSLMIAADAVRVGVFAALPFAPNAATVVGLAAVAGLATGFFRPAVYAGIPNLVPDEELPRANALLQGVENLSWALGPLVGGILVAAASPSAAYAVNAVSFVVSILLVVRIPPRLLQSERALSRGHWRDLRDGFAATFRSPSMRAVLVAWGIASVAMGAANAVEIFLAKHTFHAGDVGFGFIYSAIGAGLVLGSLLSASLLSRLGVARTYGGSLALMAVGYLAAAVSPNVWVASLCVFVTGVGNGVAIACNALLVQRGTFDLLRGRALTFVISFTYALLGVGNAIGGLLLDPTGPRWIWGASGLLLVAAAAAGALMARTLGGEAPAEDERSAGHSSIDPSSIREGVRAIRLETPPEWVGANGIVLESAPDYDRMGKLLDPLVEAHGLDAVLATLTPHRADPDLADAIFFVCWENEHDMLTVFSDKEVTDAAVQLLLEFAEDKVTDTRGLPHWGWSALWQHEYDVDDHLTNDRAFAILLKVIERIPLDDSILWMIGDGPLYHARQHREYRERVEELARTEPKIARAIQLDEDYRVSRPDWRIAPLQSN